MFGFLQRIVFEISDFRRFFKMCQLATSFSVCPEHSSLVGKIRYRTERVFRSSGHLHEISIERFHRLFRQDLFEQVRLLSCKRRISSLFFFQINKEA